ASATRHDRLFLTDRPAHFAQLTWFDAQRFEFPSISAAAKHLRGLQRNWWLCPTAARGRAKLIQEQLPPLKPKPLDFGAEAPKAPLGAWTLLDERTLLYAARTSSPFPDGEVRFNEDKVGPPSRAYLKLWEHFTLEGTRP